MPQITRRSLLLGSATAGLGLTAATAAPAAAAPTAAAARVNRIPVTRETHRVVVVGSGFGGGVTALRLAQAGVPVLVLERGIRWPTGPNAETFPHATRPDERALWHESSPELFGKPVLLKPYTGLLEAVSGDNITALCAAGVGGGSLVYQGMTLQPDRAVFETHLPAGLDYTTMSRVHYPRVARMLGVGVAPDELIASKNYQAARVFARNTTAAGYPLAKIPMPIDWNFALRELAGEMKPSYTNGDCAIGVNNGGKHSVDVTYIAAAEATGRVTVRTLSQVTGVARTRDGRWQVSVDRTDTTGAVRARTIITTKALVMAAGSLNTSRLLVRAAATGQITDLPDGLGSGWGTNADRIYVWTSLQDDFGSEQGGPVVYCSRDWAEPGTANTVIQASIPPTGANLRSTMLVGFGVSSGRGRFAYDSASDTTRLHWPKDGDAVIQRRIDPRVRTIAGRWSVVTDTNTVANSTWHPLGGASMGTVCDLEGRVLGQRGLYVLDGALMPGNTAACNPSMTIAAVAERALDKIVVKDVGTVI